MKNIIRSCLSKFRRPPRVIQMVRAEALTYLDERALLDLYQAVREVDAKSTPGLLIEAGCALGGSAIVIATAKDTRREFYVYDVFGMIPPPSTCDGADVQQRYATIKSGQATGIGGNKYYGYEDNLLRKVTANFTHHGIDLKKSAVHLVPGLFQDTIHIDQKVALAHIDGDWYESVKTCLERIVPYLALGGILVVDDYDAWSGCKKAVDEYFKDRSGTFEFVRKSRLHIVRTNP